MYRMRYVYRHDVHELSVQWMLPLICITDHNQKEGYTVQHTKAVAFSGVITALSFIVLMMTGMIPLGTFLFPTVAGLFILSIKIERGYHYAVISYIAVSLLSLLFCPDKTAMIAFILNYACYFS